MTFPVHVGPSTFKIKNLRLGSGSLTIHFVNGETHLGSRGAVMAVSAHAGR